MTSAIQPKIEYIYPTVNQYPVDPVCSKIVKALKDRNWEVQGVNVEFYDSKVEAVSTIFRKVRTIEGKDFRIYFSRIQGLQGSLGGVWNNTAGVTKINIPKKEISVYEDESGPTFYVYVGKDWELDRQKFIFGPKLNAKVNNKPRTYLRYSGGCKKPGEEGSQYTRIRVRSPYLVTQNDLNRDYSPIGDEPTYYKTDEVFQEFMAYLEENVLNEIEKTKTAYK